MVLSLIKDTLKQVKPKLEKHFKIIDWQGVELILAVAAAHYTPGEMLWFRVIAPSRSRHTEILRSMSDCPTVSTPIYRDKDRLSCLACSHGLSLSNHNVILPT